MNLEISRKIEEGKPYSFFKNKKVIATIIHKPADAVLKYEGKCAIIDLIESGAACEVVQQQFLEDDVETITIKIWHKKNDSR